MMQPSQPRTCEGMKENTSCFCIMINIHDCTLFLPYSHLVQSESGMLVAHSTLICRQNSISTPDLIMIWIAGQQIVVPRAVLRDSRNNPKTVTFLSFSTQASRITWMHLHFSKTFLQLIYN